MSGGMKMTNVSTVLRRYLFALIIGLIGKLWSSKSLANIYGFPGGSKNRRGDVYRVSPRCFWLVFRCRSSSMSLRV